MDTIKTRIGLVGLAFALGIGLVPLSVAPAFAQTRSLSLKPAEERRSRIVDVIGTAPLDGRDPAREADRTLLRDSAVAAAKAAAFGQVAAEIAQRSTPTLTLSVRGTADESVFLIDAVDLPADAAGYRVQVRAEVRFQIDQTEPVPVAPAPTPAPVTEAAPSAVAEAAPATVSQTAPAAVAEAAPAAVTPPTDNTPAVADAPPAAPPIAPPAETTRPPELVERLLDPQAPLTVDLKIVGGKTSFVEGEEIVVALRANKDFYGRIVFTDVEGKAIQVLPNDYRTDNAFKAGVTYIIPGPDDKFQMLVAAPFGTESFRVYASTAPLGDAGPSVAAGAGLAQLQAPPAEVGRRTRSLKLMAKPVEAPVATLAPVAAAPVKAEPVKAEPTAVTVASAAPVAIVPAPEFFEALFVLTTRPKQ